MPLNPNKQANLTEKYPLESLFVSKNVEVKMNDKYKMCRVPFSF